MFWYTKNIGACGYHDYEDLSKNKELDIEFITVWDLIDGYQKNWGQFESKVKILEKLLKKGGKVAVVCRGGMSRSNAVVLAYLLKSGMEWDKAYNLIRTNPCAMIEPELLSQIKHKYVKKVEYEIYHEPIETMVDCEPDVIECCIRRKTKKQMK